VQLDPGGACAVVLDLIRPGPAGGAIAQNSSRTKAYIRNLQTARLAAWAVVLDLIRPGPAGGAIAQNLSKTGRFVPGFGLFPGLFPGSGCPQSRASAHCPGVPGVPGF